MSRDTASSPRESDKTTLEMAPISRGETKSRDPLVHLVFYHHSQVRTLHLAEGESVVVGRAWPSDLLIDDPGLSRQHARFERNGHEIVVEDLGSRNGTTVNEERVERAHVNAGQRIRLSEVMAAVHWVSDSPRTALDTYDRFGELVDYEVARCGATGRSLSLIMLELDDPVAPIAEGAWFEKVRQATRPLGRITLYDPKTLLLLLPEVDSSAATSLAASLDGGKEMPAARLAVATFPSAGTTREELVSQVKDALLQTTPGARVRSADIPVRPAPQATDAVIESSVMKELFDLVSRVAAADLPVLILGETGTGKELIAERLHRESPRASKAFRTVNCAAIPATLVESVLFGHERGAFTGASRAQRGVFEDSDGGTVFLDEIGELGPGAQAALLRVLESKTITRVGGSRERIVDIRVVAATHRDLDAMVREGQFRLDLLFRLNTIPLRVPPLRDRVEEIEPLVLHFLDRARARFASNALGIAEEALETLSAYQWPGNVRELRNVVERACVLSSGPLISTSDLPDKIRSSHSGPIPAADATSESPDAAITAIGSFKEKVRNYEERLILEGLRRAEWNQSRAAEFLRMPLRTLVFKMRAYELKKSFERKEN